MDRAGACTVRAADADDPHGDRGDVRSDLAAIDAMPLSELIAADACADGAVLRASLRRFREQTRRERHEISAFGSSI